MQTVRTTIELDKDLFKAAKQRAIDEDKSFKQVVSDVLKKKLMVKTAKKVVNETKKYPFKAYHMGEIKGNLSREEIYDWL